MRSFRELALRKEVTRLRRDGLGKASEEAREVCAPHVRERCGFEAALVS